MPQNHPVYGYEVLTDLTQKGVANRSYSPFLVMLLIFNGKSDLGHF
jgi:hypothetical protein